MDNSDNIKNNKNIFISRSMADTEYLAGIFALKFNLGDELLNKL